MLTSFYEYLLKSSTLVVTAFVGIAAAFVSYQQWRLAQHKVKMDLYEKRVQVYYQVKELSRIKEQLPQMFELSGWKPKFNDQKILDDFSSATSPAFFLFGEDVRQHLVKLRDAYANYVQYRRRVGDGVSDEENNARERMNEWSKEVALLEAKTDEVFKPYLSLMLDNL